MPQPTNLQVHVDHFLSDVAVRYAQERDVFIAPHVFPLVPVQHQSDLYAVFPKGWFMRDEVTLRPLGGRPAQVGFEIERKRYACEERALEYVLDDRVRANADQPIEPELRAVELLTEQMLIHRDREWAEAYFRPGVWNIEWTGETTPSGSYKFKKFSLPESEDPVLFFDERRREMRELTGQRANKIVLGAELYVALKNNPHILERVKYTAAPPAVVTTKILATLFDVDEVLVAEAVRNVAAEGEAEQIQFIVDTRSALIVHAAPGPSITQPSAGYTFVWNQLIPGFDAAMGLAVMRGREELAHSDVFQVRSAYDMGVVAPDLGIFIHSAV
jgi:hypothetical protein